MKITKFFIKFSVILALLLFFGLIGSHVEAATACNSQKVISSNGPYWGSDPNSGVTITTGSPVPISIKGEDGCAGQIAVFDISDSQNLIKQISLTLNQGTPVAGQPGVLLFTSNWTADLGQGTYYANIRKIGSTLLVNTNISNALNITTSQSCNISKVYVNPTLPSSGGKPGDIVQLTVEAQGSCQGWKASLNVVNVDPGTPASRLTPFQGSPQDTSSLKAVWSWTFPAVTNGRQWDDYQLSANMGNQIDVRSPSFCVGTCGIQRYICSGTQCISYQGQQGTVYTTSNCDDKCTSGVPGTTQSYSFEIPNPLKGGASDFTSLVKIIAQWIFNLAIPIAVAMIVYAGILFLTSKGDTGQVTKAKEVLKYAVIGLAIILIGSGFITLIKSVLELGGTTPPAGGQLPPRPLPPGPLPPGPAPAPGSGAMGTRCNADRDCFSGLKCAGICQRQSGNLVREPCLGVRDCATGLNCDLTSAGKIFSDPTLGSCFQPPGGTQSYGCNSSLQCVPMVGGAYSVPDCYGSCGNPQ